MLKYEKIASDYRNKILDNILKANEQLPLEKEMQKIYNVSRITVKKAVDILVDEGLVIKRRGSGTFVKAIDESQALNFATSRQFAGFNKTHSDHVVTSDVLEFKVVLPSEEVQKHLRISANSWVYYFERVRLIDNEPIVLEYTYVPMEVIKGLTKSVLQKSFYSYIEDKLGLVIESAHRSITCDLANDYEQKYLNLKIAAVAKVEETAFLSTGVAFSYSILVHKKFDYKVIVQKQNY